MIPSRFKGPLVKTVKRKLNGADKTMIQMIQGNIHVGKSDMWVARYWLKRSRVKFKKAVRFAIARYALNVHHGNQDDYHFAMGGNRWQAIDKRRKALKKEGRK